MTTRILSAASVGVLTVICASMLAPPPALACGNDEVTVCDEGGTAAADDARWLLGRAVAAVNKDESRALDAFTHGTGGFRTQDLYVFCIDTVRDEVVAHPDPALRGQNAAALRDPNGKAFASEMLDVAREGQFTQVSYLFPRPGSTVPVPKMSFVTRVRDLVCGVGYYPEMPQQAAAPETTEASESRLASLRRRFDTQMPEQLRPALVHE